MFQIDRSRPSIPAIYPQLILQLMEERGYDRREVLRRVDFRIPESRVMGLVLRISIEQQEQLTRTIIQMARERGEDPGGFGYEMGLGAAPATHGVLGFALLSQLTARQAVNFFLRFSALILPGVRLRLHTKESLAILEVAENFQLSPDLRHEFYEMTLAGLWRSLTSFIPESRDQIELWFAHAQPEYHVRYAQRLPRCRFGMDTYQLRVPAELLDRKLATGDALAAKDLEGQCQRELDLVGSARDVVAQVQDLLHGERGSFPDLDAVSAQLRMAPSTLRRKLQQAGRNFQQLREEAMQSEAMHLLRDAAIPIEKIATRLGYADPANFTHAFRKWTGLTPSAYRQQQTKIPT